MTEQRPSNRRPVLELAEVKQAAATTVVFKICIKCGSTPSWPQAWCGCDPRLQLIDHPVRETYAVDPGMPEPEPMPDFPY